MDFKAISTRICNLRIKQKFFNYTIINIHAPTEVLAEEERKRFQDPLRKTYQEIPCYDVKIVIRDMNAQVGKEEIYCSIKGIQSA
jgi:hypothetical protein